MLYFFSANRSIALYFIVQLLFIVFIRTSAYRNGDCISEFFLGNTVTVLFHFLYCDQGLADNFNLTERMRIRYEFVLSSEYLLDYFAHDAVLVAIEQFFNRNLCHVCYLLGFLVTHNIPQKMAQVQRKAEELSIK